MLTEVVAFLLIKLKFIANCWFPLCTFYPHYISGILNYIPHNVQNWFSDSHIGSACKHVRLVHFWTCGYA